MTYNILSLCLIPLALLLDRVLGEAPTRFHPVAIMGTWATKVESFMRWLLLYADQKFTRDINSNKKINIENINLHTTVEANKQINENIDNNKLEEKTENKKNNKNKEKTELIHTSNNQEHIYSTSKWVLRVFGLLSALFTIIPFVFTPIILIILINSSAFIPVIIQDFLVFFIALFCLYLCIAPRSLAEHALAIAKPLQENNIIAAQKAVSAIVGRSTKNMDSSSVARACVESVGENVTDSVLSSLFWASVGLILFGFLGSVFFALLHRCFNTLDAMWGKRNEQYQYFGTFAARTDDILNFFPARLSLFSIVIAAYFTKKTNYKEAWRVGYAYRYSHNSPNSAWSEAAFAGALGLKLGGPVNYGTLFVDYPYFGDGTLHANDSHIHLAIKLMWNCVWVFSFISCIMIFLLT